MNNRASHYIGAAIGAITGLYLSCTGFFSLRRALMAAIAGVALLLIARAIRRAISHG